MTYQYYNISEHKKTLGYKDMSHTVQIIKQCCLPKLESGIGRSGLEPVADTPPQSNVKPGQRKRNI